MNQGSSAAVRQSEALSFRVGRIHPKDLEIARHTPGPDLDRTYDWDEIDDLLEEVEKAPILYSNNGRLFGKIV